MISPKRVGEIDDQLKRASKVWLLLPAYEKTRMEVWLPTLKPALRDSGLLIQVFLDDKQSHRQFEEVVRKEPRGRYGAMAQVELWSPMKTVTDLVKHLRIILDPHTPKKASVFDLGDEGFTATNLDVDEMLLQISDAMGKGTSPVTVTNVYRERL